MAVADSCAVSDVACNAADIAVASDIGFLEGDLTDDGTIQIPKESGILRELLADELLADGKVSDGLTIAIEVATEIV